MLCLKKENITFEENKSIFGDTCIYWGSRYCVPTKLEPSSGRLPIRNETHYHFVASHVIYILWYFFTTMNNRIFVPFTVINCQWVILAIWCILNIKENEPITNDGVFWSGNNVLAVFVCFVWFGRVGMCDYAWSPSRLTN